MFGFLGKSVLEKKSKTPMMGLAFILGSFVSFGLSFSINTSSVSAAVYSASITTSGALNLNLSTTSGGADVITDDVKVVSTCPLGYTLSIAATSELNNTFNDTTLYKNGDTASTSSILTSTGTMSNPATITGSNVGTWGYSLTSTTASGTFVGLTTTTNTLVDKASASATGGDNTPVHYGASVEDSMDPGIYKMSDNASITYYLVSNVNCGNFNIVYNGNDNDTGTTMSVNHSNVQEDDELTLYASNYKKAGYGFAGWSTVQLDPDDSDFQTDLRAAVAAGKVYGPNETITADASFLAQAENIGGTNTITLYAIWVPSSGYIQNWTGCIDMTQGEVKALKDQRDNNVYTVAKLADGNCWMIENLRLDAANSSDRTKAQGFGGVFAGLANSEPASNFYNDDSSSSTTLANSLYYRGTQSGTATIDIGVGVDPPRFRMPRYNNVNTTNAVSVMTKRGQNVYSYGNYYNWAAAIADTSEYRTNNENANYTSICPAGWKLPRGGDKSNESYNEFWNLMVNGLNNGVKPANYSSSDYPYYTREENTPLSNAVRSYPTNFIYSGMIEDDPEDLEAPMYRGGGGYLWSSTSSTNSSISYRTGIDTNNGINGVSPGTTRDIRTSGASVRCLAQPTYRVHFDANGGSGTMGDQDFHRDMAAALNPNTFTAPAGNNKHFGGWNTSPDGTGTGYSNEEIVTNVAAANQDFITLYAQWDNSYEMIYEKNGADVEGAGAYGYTFHYQGGFSWDDNTTSMNLRAPNYKRTGYGFAGWSTDPNVASSINSNNHTYIYGPEEIMTTSDDKLVSNADENNIIRLYAVWVPSAGNLQGWNGCPSMPVGNVTALTDTRDNETYAVAKLVDGNCWTIENYRLNPGTANITTANTNNPTSGFISAASGTHSTNYTDWCLENNSPDLECPDSVSYNTLHLDGLSSKTNYAEPRYRDGVYYNWYTATAGNGTMSMSNQTTAQASGDLCPSGWHIPTGGSSGGELMSSFNLIGLNGNVLLFPNNFVAARGIFDNSAPKVERGEMFLLSSTAGTTPGYAANLHIHHLSTDNAGGSVPNYSYHNRGIPFRCIVKPQYTITYNANSGTGTMAQTHTNVKTGDEITLYASNFSRSNYGFAGWSFDPNAQPGDTSKIYGPNETITVPADIPGDANGVATLYAVWVQSAGDIQSWTGCSDMSVGDVTALKDTRDNDVYAVAKLADGSCWMIENLRLDNTNSDNSTGTLAQGYGTSTTYGNFSGLANAESPWANPTSGATDATNANSLYYAGTQSGTATINISQTDYAGYRMPRYNNQNTQSRATNPTDGSGNIYSYGNYYTWAAAIADTTHYGTENSSATTTSICPTGWRLPQGGSKSRIESNDDNDFWNLVVDELNDGTNPANYDDVSCPYYTGAEEAGPVDKLIRTYPNNFLYSGNVSSSLVNARGSTGYYWTSTNYTDIGAFNFRFGNTSVYSGTGQHYKYYGRAVRCMMD